MTDSTRSVDLGTPGVLVDIRGRIGQITFNNPARRNAMSLRMWQALGDAAEVLEADPDVRVVVMRGAGGKAFISGDDITEFATLRSTLEQKEAYTEIVNRAYAGLASLDKPLLAFVEGACVGAGLPVALAADIRFAVKGARFAIPAARLGVGCEYSGITMVARLVGPSVAKDIYFSARYLDAEEALRVGLINALFDLEQGEAALSDYVEGIARNAPLTIRGVKHAIRVFERYSMNPACEEVSQMSNKCFQSEDYREGSRAFMAKRLPEFKGV